MWTVVVARVQHVPMARSASPILIAQVLPVPLDHVQLPPVQVSIEIFLLSKLLAGYIHNVQIQSRMEWKPMWTVAALIVEPVGGARPVSLTLTARVLNAVVESVVLWPSYASSPHTLI